MKLDLEALRVAAQAAQDASSTEVVYDYGEDPQPRDAVDNWEEIAGAVIAAYLKAAEPELRGDRLAREIARRFANGEAIGKPTVHNIGREVLIPWLAELEIPELFYLFSSDRPFDAMGPYTESEVEDRKADYRRRFVRPGQTVAFQVKSAASLHPPR